MDLIEVSVRADGEAAEAVIEVFDRYGLGGAVVEEVPGVDPPLATVKAYLAARDGSARRRRELEEALWHLRQLHPFSEPSFKVLKERDWTDAWKEGYSVQHIGGHLVVRPSWLGYEPGIGETVVTLDPGLAFGTGLHPSTRLCLVELERLSPPGRVLDVGTGSGILAVFAARLGATEVVALDTDPTAVEVARRNAELNGVDHVVEVILGSVSEGEDPLADDRRFDLVLANILADVIQRLAPDLARRLAPAGLLVASGIIEARAAATASALEAAGLAVAGRRRQEDWVAITARARRSEGTS